MRMRSRVVKSALGTCAVVITLCGVVALSHGAAEGRPSSGMAAIPAAGTYKVDPMHSFAYFGAWHHIVALVRGRFDKVTGTITAAKNPAECSVDISIDAARS